MEIETLEHISVLAMSTKEIAELTGKRHDHVVRDMKVMLDGLYGVKANAPKMTQNWVIEGVQGVTVSTDARAYIVAGSLDKSHTMTLVAGYDVRVRKRIVDRWLELEAKEMYSASHRDVGALAGAVQSLAGLVAKLSDRVEAIDKARIDEAEAKRAEAREQARVDERFQQDQRRIGVDFISAYDVLSNVPRKGRGDFVPRVRRALKDFARLRGHADTEEAARSNGYKERLFSRATVDAWLTEQGHAMIAAHLAKQPYARAPASGQGALKLVFPEKKK